MFRSANTSKHLGSSTTINGLDEVLADLNRRATEAHMAERMLRRLERIYGSPKK